MLLLIKAKLIIMKKETYEVTKLEGEKVYFINDKGQEDFFMSTNKKMVEIKD